MSSSTSKSPKSTCTQSNSSWNNATHWIHISHLATTWPEPVLNLTAGKEVILRKPTTSQPGVPDHTTPLVNWLNQNYWPIGVFWPVYHLHRDQKLDLTSNCSPQRYQLLLHNVDTDLGRQATIPTYSTIQVDLWLLAAPCQHRLWTESYHPDIHDTRGPVTACYNISTTMDGKYHPDIQNTRGLDRLLQYQHRQWTEMTILTNKIQEDLWPLATIQVAEFRLKLPNKGGRYHLDIKH